MSPFWILGFTTFVRAGPVALQQGVSERGSLSCVFVTLSALSLLRFGFHKTPNNCNIIEMLAGFPQPKVTQKYFGGWDTGGQSMISLETDGKGKPSVFRSLAWLLLRLHCAKRKSACSCAGKRRLVDAGLVQNLHLLNGTGTAVGKKRG